MIGLFTVTAAKLYLAEKQSVNGLCDVTREILVRDVSLFSSW